MRQKNDLSSKKIKTFTPKLIIAASESSADILYASKFNAPDDFLYYETESEKCIVVSPLEYSRALEEAGEEVKVIDRVPLMKQVRQGESFAVALSRILGINCWQVPASFPYSEAQALLNAGIQLQCLEDQPFFPERLVKNEKEIEAIQASVAVTEEIMCQLRDILIKSKINTKGFLEYKRRILTCEFLRSELEGNFKKKGFSASHTIIAPGIQGAAPHNHGTGPVPAGVPIVADIFPRSDATGYWGDMTRTFVKGKAKPIVKRAFKAVKKASDTAKKMLHDGVIAADVHKAAAEVLTAAGFPTGRGKDGMPCGFFHGLGHGVGLEIHEAPRVSPLNEKPLVSGNVVSIEPGLYYPEWGGIRLEDLVVIQKKSYRNFNTMEMELELP
ncbi:MAG: aminopeptidase P family protein [Lentisphaeria bacterium]|nr:aminopeptidase P family protein [Lentisphaeria bacterium]